MKLDVKKAVVLGAGTMGAQMAAHLAACGIEVLLLDVVPPGSEDRSILSRRGLEGLKALKPSPIHLRDDLRLVRVGNFEDDWAELRKTGWVLEAILEDLEVKRQLLARVASAVSPTAVVSTNTSGLGIAAMSDHLPATFRRRFFGTHFFNPPRYLKLLETIPGPDTDPELLAAMEEFCAEVVGKGVVRCKDTPNFIGNRVGMFAMAATLRAMVEMDMTIDEVDALTGPAIAHPRSATFRTADLAGVDLVARVARNISQSVSDDAERGAYTLPPFVEQMVARGLLGEKAGAGFYRKEGREIRVLDWKTLDYRERRKPAFPSVEAAAGLSDPAARMRQLVAGTDKAAVFLWRLLSEICFYAASKVPEVSEDVVSVDRAMEWGFGWGHGPFKLLDALGVDDVARRASGEGHPLPPLVQQLLASGRQRFYERAHGRTTMFGLAGVSDVVPVPRSVDILALKAEGRVTRTSAGASLVDLGDGCGLVEFHSKMNTLGPDAISMLAWAARSGREHFDALVVSNQGESFSAGANLMLVLVAAQDGEWDELDEMVRGFQSANMALKYSDIPVVVAPFGLTLGGGCEITLHGARVRLSAETYMGLVEAGVGVIPAGGGTKEMAIRALDRCAGVSGADPFPFLRAAFETIAFARVSTSGAEARRMFLTDADSLTRNPDRLIRDAKEVALGLARAGYRPGRPRTDIPALGRPSLAVFRAGVHNALRGGQISDHDALIGTKLAVILCGGDRSPGTVTEQELLDLEREAFLSLLGTAKTQQRIAHMLKEGKPLRN